MLWLQPFVEAAGTAPLLCSHVLGAAGLGKQGGQGSGAGRHWGAWQRWMGQWAVGPVAAEMWQRVEGSQDTAQLPQLSKASWYSQSTFPQPTQWQGCLIGVQLEWLSGLYVKGSTQL